MGLAYLFARAADTIADTGQLDQNTRIDCLRRLKSQFVKGSVDTQEIKELQGLVAPHQGNPSEQLLLNELAHCFTLYQQLIPEDQARIGSSSPDPD